MTSVHIDFFFFYHKWPQTHLLNVAHLCYSSARFEGSLNMDLNEIAMNLVPFPRLHYLVPSLTPLYTLADVSVPPRRSAVWLAAVFFALPHIHPIVLSGHTSCCDEWEGNPLQQWCHWLEGHQILFYPCLDSALEHTVIGNSSGLVGQYDKKGLFLFLVN